jgi:hypothetical protein
LITWLKQCYDLRNPGVLVTVPLIDLGDFPTTRRMLLGIQQRDVTEGH